MPEVILDRELSNTPSQSLSRLTDESWSRPVTESDKMTSSSYLGYAFAGAAGIALAAVAVLVKKPELVSSIKGEIGCAEKGLTGETSSLSLSAGALDALHSARSPSDLVVKALSPTGDFNHSSSRATHFSLFEKPKGLLDETNSVRGAP